MSNLSLAGWLERLEQLHPSAIDLGLSRCGEVGRRLDVVDTGIITATVAGTNGKGTTVAVMESVLCANGLHCGAFTSPHLIRFNERIRVDGQEVSDETIVAAFEAIECAREEISLTYFEFGALAALWIFKAFNVQYQLLEVGLGGRLDAVNIIDADVTVITAIGLDHQEWLGETVDAIAVEKCGIARASVSCVVADANAPNSVFRELGRLGAKPFVVGENYQYDERVYRSSRGVSIEWKLAPGVLGINAAAAMAALDLLGVPLSTEMIATAMASLNLQGRRERRRLGDIDVILDVAHNPDAAIKLREFLEVQSPVEHTVAVFAVMSDKDCHDMVSSLEGLIDFWCLPAGIGGSRGQAPSVLSELISGESAVYTSFSLAWESACARAGARGRVVVFGSFFTVGEGLAALNSEAHLGLETGL
ncbi:bifunctional folylpolyglutamate synthase/dihydrofolate synthase [Luminiphilus sp.]|nr:bifunctional folylpolyglutamate synthase/dihydrofolate synthase [Luminiphilus sp.]